MLIIPLKAISNQVVTVTLANQVCQIDVYQQKYGLFVDLYVSNKLIIGGVICQNLNPIVRSEYLGFLGDLAWIDSQGDEDPVYTGIGERFNLAYLTADELA